MHLKVLPQKELAPRREQLRAEGRTVVLTNGCFDLLHVGHTRYLAQAKALGNVLVVGLNSDESVRKIKGPGRPVTPETERAEILAALEAVDFVTIFREDTAATLVDVLHPDVYAKGGDYSADPKSPLFPPEGHLVRRQGGVVRIIDYVPGHSTADILSRLRRDLRRED